MSSKPSVGTPLDQKNASSSCPSRLGPVSMPSDLGVMSFSGSMPAASSTRVAISRTPELGSPMATRLPFRSATDRMSESGGTTSCT